MRGLKVSYKRLGSLLRDARKKAGLTADDAAMMLGLANGNFLYNAESGAVNFPARRLIRALEVYGLKRKDIIEAIVADDVEGVSKFMRGGK